MYHYHDVATAVYRRAFVDNPNTPGNGDSPDVYEIPAWSWLLVIANIILFFPALVFVDYTIRQIFPVLAIVENENPPAYEPVSLEEDAATRNADNNGVPKPAGAAVPHGEFAHTVTGSLRACHRLLRSTGGFRAIFRGFACFCAQVFLTIILMGIFSASLGSNFTPIATLLASLSLVQFSTAWVHIVISQPTQQHFWSRLPPFKRTFDATWKAVTLYWAAMEFSRFLPLIVGQLLGFRFLTSDSNTMPDGAIAKMFVVMGLAVISSIFVVIPAHIVLIRVQASLLPEDTETIVPFDRSFNGTVEPAIVGGRGYATITDAWKTFTRGAWRRLVKLYVKIYLVSIAFATFFFFVIFAQASLIVANTKKVNNGGN
jgi:hypothetical protein